MGAGSSIPTPCASSASSMNASARRRPRWQGRLVDGGWRMIRKRLRRWRRRLGERAVRALRPVVLCHREPAGDLGLEKIGSGYGGWIVPTAKIDRDWTCYCAGVGEDITFDLGLISRFGC